jgi:hypothetical protein
LHSVKFNKPKRTDDKPALDGSDPNHPEDSDFQNKKKLKGNEGLPAFGVNVKLKYFQ